MQHFPCELKQKILYAPTFYSNRLYFVLNDKEENT